jgi:nicotinamide-nucleotide amidase
MKACIVCFGDEILSGACVNTNAAFMSKILNELGIFVAQQLTLSDFDHHAESILKSLSFDYDVIICSGGLGPTVDDKTRELFANLTLAEMYFDENVHSELIKKFGEEPYHKIQSMLPRGAILLHNETGTAKGLCVTLNKALLFALPGVPHEMKTMLLNEVVPFLRDKLHLEKSPFEKTISFFDLIEVQLDPHLKKLHKLYPEVKFGIYPSYGTVKVTFQGFNHMDIDNIEKYFDSEFSSWIFTHSSKKIEEVLFDALIAQKLKLAAAESITGGSISKRLVAMPGVSSQFLGSFVTYSKDMKKNVLGVSEKTLSSYGAVSEKTAFEMLEGALKISSADVAIAVTGIAGPTGGSDSKPVGLVYIAVGHKNGDNEVHTCHFKGDRDIIIEKAATYSFGYLLQFLKTKH